MDLPRTVDAHGYSHGERSMSQSMVNDDGPFNLLIILLMDVL